MRPEEGVAARLPASDNFATPHNDFAAVKDFTAGVAAGVALVVTGHPFDTVKVKLQASNAASPASLGAPQYRSAWQCTSHILRTEGIPGLYRGATSSFVGVAVESSLLFGSYTQIKTALQGGERSAPSAGTVATAAGLAGGLISFVLCPTELVKCRLQVQAKTPALTPAASISTAAAAGATAPAAAAAASKRAPAMAHLTPSFAAAAHHPATAATTPFAASSAFPSLARSAAAAAVSQQIRSQQHSQPQHLQLPQRVLAGAGHYKGPWDCVVQTVKTNGPQGLFRGLAATAWRESLGNVCFFLTYEAIKHRLLPALTHSHTRTPPSHHASPSSFSDLAMLESARGEGEGNAMGAGSRQSSAESSSSSEGLSRLDLTTAMGGGAEGGREGGASGAGGMSEWQRVAAEAATAIASGGIAGIVFWSAVLPFDVIKTRIQTADASASPASLRMLSQCKAILRESGIRGFYAGLVPTLSRAFPANAAAVVAWELTSRLLGVSNA
ncbi:hypothetical protein CLOM_g16560 [Closterium sp. NIES-68]|nr:hypothetical protein CLOM_g16560 [Closterium sp. NIES-68]GJP69302.1 hypothetical protein CLOP_g241 [Closterium sp. NIES-67]